MIYLDTISAPCRRQRSPLRLGNIAIPRRHAVGRSIAAMEELNISRLMTLDQTQGRAARALGYKVTYPGVAL